MTSHRFFAVCALTIFGAATAQAQAILYPSDVGYYGEVGYSPIELKVDGGITSHPDTMRFIVGKEIHENWAVEAMYTATVSDDKKTLFAGKTNNFGISLKPKVALTNDTELFARLGMTHSHITASESGEKNTDHFSYGVGLQTKFTSSVYGQVDYMNYYHKDGIRVQGYGVSVGYRF